VAQSPDWESADPAERKTILLLGDSTVIGSVPRILLPEADHLEGVVVKLLDAREGLPPVKVINEGRGGDWVRQLLDDRLPNILPAYPEVDIVTLRYGLNDLRKREDFENNFIPDLKEAIAKLRETYPEAQIFLETVIVYFDAERSAEINDRVRTAAVETGTPLIDQYGWTARVRAEGNTLLSYRRMPLSEIPEHLHPLLPEPYREGEICVLDNTLDIHFKGIDAWFSDQHPNLAGYHVIGTELARHFSQALGSEKPNE
jgi:lysophospholipase L1-like esterase